ncbi:MAG: DnaB-like helicase N-terminal domain-containing protein, partial [Solirubrobacterales bacterium]
MAPEGPPHDTEAEASVLGAMLVSDPAVGRVIDDVRLRTEDFYLDRHRAIFEVMLDLYAKGDACDELTVRAALDSTGRTDEAGGANYVSELAAKVPAPGNARNYAQIVRE